MISRCVRPKCIKHFVFSNWGTVLFGKMSVVYEQVPNLLLSYRPDLLSSLLVIVSPCQ